MRRLLLFFLLIVFGFQFIYCEKNKVTCTSGFCQNGGHCVISSQGQRECSCTDEYFGAHCEYRKCSIFNPCENGGICEKTDSFFQCHCPLGYTGRLCTDRLDTVCDTQPCGNGMCKLTATIADYECQCYYGYTGKNCTKVDYCVDKFCSHGKCINEPDGHRCECDGGWTGEGCREDIDECRSNQCSNQAACHNTPGSFYCECPEGFHGSHCELEFNANASECVEGFCKNGGTCSIEEFSLNSYPPRYFNELTCLDCNAGFVGERCERRVDPCTLHDCLNGGVCSDNTGWYLGGSSTSLDVTEAMNNGWTTQMLGAACRCPPGYKGDDCTVDVNECELADGVCLNGATCVNTFGGYRCVCMGGFKGTRCEINEDDCEENLCYSGSKCVDGIARYECLCQEDRIGMFCDFVNPCFGDKNRCVHGECFANPEFGNHTCECKKGFHGIFCDEDVDECAMKPNPCQLWSPVGAKCVNTFGSFHCDELVGTIERMDFCASNPCENGATCVNFPLEETFECLCLYGYSGEQCEVREYEAKNNCTLQCENGGICREPSAQNCECAPPFEGKFCEHKKQSPCVQNDCKNNSTCQPSLDYIYYTCQCAPDLSGERCEIELRPCVDYNPCIYGACRHDIKLERHSNNLQSANNEIENLTTFIIDNVGEVPIDNHYFECECQEGYSGTICDLPIPPTTAVTTTTNMDTKTIVNLLCITKLVPINDNATNTIIVPFVDGELNNSTITCKNNGTCVQSSITGEYKCICSDGFSGEFCQYQAPNVTDKKSNVKNALRNCQSEVMCKNNGTCTTSEKDGGIWLGCNCKDGFSGEFCELDLNECDPEPCQNDGCCINLINGFRCECKSEFFGDRCEFRNNETKKENKNEEELPEPFSRCADGVFCSRVFMNGKCDKTCNLEECLYDGFDCASTANKCLRLDYCASVYGNAMCDADCNVSECGWDGGDCDDEAYTPTTEFTSTSKNPAEVAESDILSGELMLILLINEAEFSKLAHQFMLRLSANLRASIRVARDELGRPKIYKWQNDSGVDSNPLELPFYFETNWLSANFPRKKREVPWIHLDYDIVETKNTVLHGIQLFLEINVKMCHNVQQISANSFQCFSNVESAAQLLNAENKHGVFPDLTGVLLYSAQISPQPARQPPSSLSTIIASISIFSLCLLAVVQGTRVAFKRRLISAPVYRPPKLKSEKVGSSMLSVNSMTSYTFTNTNNANHKSNANFAAEYQNNLNSQILSAGKIGANSDKYEQYYQLGLQDQLYSNNKVDHSFSQAIGNENIKNEFCTNTFAKFDGDDIYATPLPDPLSAQNHFDSGIEGVDEESIREKGSSYDSGNGGPYSASSGVSSAATSTVDSATTNVESQTGKEFDKFKLHKQLISMQGLIQPIDFNLVNIKDESGRTPLMIVLDEILASKKVDQKINEDIDRLMNSGADVNAQDNDGITPLILAIKLQRINIVTNLLDKHSANINLCDFDDRAPIHHAIDLLADDIFMLLMARLDVSTLNMISGTPPLSLCAEITHSPCALNFARRLIDKHVDIERIGKNGRTALHVAASVDNVSMICLLIDEGANKEAADEDRQTPLFLAAMNGHVGAVETLLRRDADKMAFDAMEKTPYDMACDNHHEPIKRILLAFPSTRTPLFFHRTNFNANNSTGNNISLSTLRQQQLQQQLNIEQHQQQQQQRRAESIKQQNPATRVRPTWNTGAPEHWRGISGGIESDNAHEADYPKPAKRTRNANIPRKNGVKACKARHCSPAVFVQQPNSAGSLMSLTPPNSDNSTTYSMTPSPNNTSLNPCAMANDSANYASDQYMRQYANYYGHSYNREQFGRVNPAPLLIKSANKNSSHIAEVEEETQTFADFYCPQLGTNLSHSHELPSPPSLCDGGDGSSSSPQTGISSTKANGGVINQIQAPMERESQQNSNTVSGNYNLIPHIYYHQHTSNLIERNNLNSYWQ